MAAGLEFVRHLIEGANQVAEFIGGRDLDAVVQVSAGDFLGGLGQGDYGASHQSREVQREPHARKQDHSGK